MFGYFLMFAIVAVFVVFGYSVMFAISRRACANLKWLT